MERHSPNRTLFVAVGTLGTMNAGVSSPGWLMRGDDVLMAAEIAQIGRDRRVGLIGRDHLEGALVLTKCRHVHTFAMRFPIDIAMCDRSGFVLRTASIVPWRCGPIARHCSFVVEMPHGAVDRHRIVRGDQLEIRMCAP